MRRTWASSSPKRARAAATGEVRERPDQRYDRGGVQTRLRDVSALAFASVALVGCVTQRLPQDAPPSAAAAVDAEAPSAPFSVPPLKRAPTILVVGDSHTYGAFGYRLHVHLAGIGRHAVVSEAAGGATTDTYLEEKPEARVGYRIRESARGEREPREIVSRMRSEMARLDEMLAHYDPEIVIVALGTNRPQTPVAESCNTFMQHLVRERPARRIFWIGPPAVGPDRGEPNVASIRSTLEKYQGATFIDSTAFNASAPLPPENPHFSPDDARRWADVTFAQIAQRLHAE